MIGAFLLGFAAASQWPQDARSLAAWYAERAPRDAVSAPRAEELRERIFVYQAAGAEAEAWAAVEALERLAPGDPDGERYAVQLAAWDPARWEDGLRLAEAWLAAHPGRGDAERGSVLRTRELLADRVGVRQAARAQQRARSWVPIGAAAAFGALAALALRRAR